MHTRTSQEDIAKALNEMCLCIYMQYFLMIFVICSCVSTGMLTEIEKSILLYRVSGRKRSAYLTDIVKMKISSLYLQ